MSYRGRERLEFGTVCALTERVLGVGGSSRSVNKSKNLRSATNGGLSGLTETHLQQENSITWPTVRINTKCIITHISESDAGVTGTAIY